MRDLRRGLWLIAAGIVLFTIAFLVATSPAFADEPGDVRGAYFFYGWNSGKFAYEPFLKVNAPTTSGEEGEPQIWGFRVWNLEPPDEHGKTHPVNIPEDRFVPCDGKAHLVTIRHPHERDRQVERWITCPREALWGR